MEDEGRSGDLVRRSRSVTRETFAAIIKEALHYRLSPERRTEKQAARSAGRAIDRCREGARCVLLGSGQCTMGENVTRRKLPDAASEGKAVGGKARIRVVRARRLSERGNRGGHKNQKRASL